MNLKKNYTKLKKQDTKGHTLCDSFCMTCPENANTQGQNTDWWVPEARERRQ